MQVIEMQSHTESIFYTIACRMAMIMNLPNATATSLVERELSLRVWWSVVATDTWSSTALGLPRAISAPYDVALPMDDRAFLRLGSETPLDLDSSVRSLSRSMIAQMIMLNQLLFRVNSLNADFVSKELETTHVYEDLNELVTEVDSWHSDLPEDMRHTPENLLYWASEGCGPMFVIMHLNYNHLNQLLLYRFLHLNINMGHPPSLDYAKRCKRHSDALCQLTYQARENPDTDVRYPLAGHMLVVASTVQLHTLLFSSDDTEVQVAKDQLQTNFRIISLLQTYWPSLKASLSRFNAFHKACLEGKDSFRFDRWMLQFLLQFAQPVDERD
ncbi:hypothetical protein HJFPF1_07159 [Paramyrothecium foliicola]|nr:hypothetical protein HJFPF1_07159 [Paramyrothecium foliicola]